MTVLTANNVSELQNAISSADDDDIIEIPAGVDWEIDNTNKATTDYAFPAISNKAITIAAVGGSERAVLSSSNDGEFCFFRVETGSLVLRNITLKNLPGLFTGSTIGYAIDCNPGSLTLDNCSFENNQTDYLYPLIYVDPDSGDVEILNCVFKDNRSYDYGIEIRGGGVIHIENCMFLNNEALEVIYSLSDTFLMINSQFWENDTTLGWSICELSTTNASVVGCGFFGNKSGADVLNTSNDSVLSIKECRFISNSADTSPIDGMLYILGGQQIVEGCYFENNSGGLIIHGKGEVRNCQFIDNNCQLSGLIRHRDIYPNSDGPLFVRGSYFGQNSGPLVYTQYTDCDICLNFWEFEPHPSRFIEIAGGQVIYDGSNSPSAPCVQVGELCCCFPAVS